MDSTLFNPVMFSGALILFGIVAASMLLLPLLLGALLRPRRPNVEKLEAYECGEPTIGSSNVQFDIRFYVVALLFIIFDVEVAFFFPWATVFGKANTLADPNFGSQQVANMSSRDEMSKILLSDPNAATVTPQAAHQLMGIALLDLIVFFSVVLVGFAYVWRRGDLDWVRALSDQRKSELAYKG